MSINKKCCACLGRYTTIQIAVFTLIGVAVEGSLGGYLLRGYFSGKEYPAPVESFPKWQHDVTKICGVLLIIASIFYFIGFVCLMLSFFWTNKVYIFCWLGFAHAQMNFGIISVLILVMSGNYYIAVVLIYYVVNFVVWLIIRVFCCEEEYIEADDFGLIIG